MTVNRVETNTVMSDAPVTMVVPRTVLVNTSKCIDRLEGQCGAKNGMFQQ